MSLQRVAFSPLHTFTRATNETFFNQVVDSFGNVSYELQTAPSGTAVQNAYDPATGEPLGLQVFEQRTNLLLWSNDLTQTGWNKSLGATTVISDVPTIDGVTFATRVSGLLGTDGDVGVQRFVSVSPSTSYNGSIYVKGEGANLGKKIQLRIKRVTGASVVVSKDVVLTDQWQRADLTITMLADNTQAQFGITRSTDIEANRADSCLVCYTQFEQGAFATPVIKTEATTATRNASVAVINDIDQSEWWNSEQGEIVARVKTNGGSSPFVFSLDDGTSGNRFAVALFPSTLSVQTRVASGGILSTNLTRFVTSLEFDDFIDIRFRWDSGNAYLTVNDYAEISTAITLPVDINTLNIAQNNAAAAKLNGHIAKLIYTPSAGA